MIKRQKQNVCILYAKGPKPFDNEIKIDISITEWTIFRGDINQGRLVIALQLIFFVKYIFLIILY
jgi:hypothetical protein